MTNSLAAAPAVHDLQEVIDSQAIRPAFQPVVRLRDGGVEAYEALARFDKEQFPSPAEAFAAATRAGIGVDLELVALERALDHLDLMPADTWLSANLSVEALLTPRVTAALLRCGGGRVAVELTEHAQVTDYESLIRVTDRLRAAGLRIAVDDAGAGFASLSHILQLRPDIIKLDITLTRGIDTDPVRAALARSLFGFAEDIGALLIAEGIETAAEHEKLCSIGIKLGQGYFMARPGPLPQNL